MWSHGNGNESTSAVTNMEGGQLRSRCIRFSLLFRVAHPASLSFTRSFRYSKRVARPPCMTEAAWGLWMRFPTIGYRTANLAVRLAGFVGASTNW